MNGMSRRGVLWAIIGAVVLVAAVIGSIVLVANRESSPEPTSPSGRPLAEETTKRLTASDAEPTSRAPMVLIGLAFAVVLVLLVVWAALR